MRSFKISHVRQLVIVALLAVLVFLTLVPILFMLVSSLKSNAQILGNFWGLPAPARWGNYGEAFHSIWRYIVNTIVYAVVGSVLDGVVVGVRLSFREEDVSGKRFLVHADAGHDDGSRHSNAYSFLCPL